MRRSRAYAAVTKKSSTAKSRNFNRKFNAKYDIFRNYFAGKSDEIRSSKFIPDAGVLECTSRSGINLDARMSRI